MEAIAEAFAARAQELRARLHVDAEPREQAPRAGQATHGIRPQPAVANIAEVVMGASKSYYIGVTGNGGILVYLGPQTR
jgi:hypothetical protein